MKDSVLKHIVTILLLYIISLTTSFFATASEIGVNSHIGMGEVKTQTIDAIAMTASGWMRDGINWTSLMDADGNFNMPERFSYVSEAKAKGLKTIVHLGYGYGSEQNPKYGYPDDRHIPLEGEEYFDDFIRMVKFVATNLRGKVDAYEIWNEPDLVGRFNYGEVDGKAYFDLCKASYDAIKMIDPKVKVLNGGIAWNTDFLDEFLAAGGSECVDAIAVHVYNHSDASVGPEKNFRSHLDIYEATLDKYNYTGDVWLTENGWFTGVADNSVDRYMQGAYLIRNKVIWDDYLKDNDRQGEYIWYNVADNGNNLFESEQNYGLYGDDLSPKPSAYSARILNKILRGMTLEKYQRVYTYAFYRGYQAEYFDNASGNKAYIMWDLNNKGNTQITISGSGRKVTVYDYLGKVVDEIENPSGNLIVKVDEYPKLILFENEYAEITDAFFDKSKNTVYLKGRASLLIDVTVNVLFDGAIEKSINTMCDENGSFFVKFSPKKEGVYKISVEGYNEKEIVVNKADSKEFVEIIGYTATMNNGFLTIDAQLNHCEEDETAKLIIVKEGKKKSEYVFIDEVEVKNGQFTKEIDLSDETEGVYEVSFSVDGLPCNMNICIPPIDVGSFTLVAHNGTFAAKASGVKGSGIKNMIIVIAQYDENGVLINADVSKEGAMNGEKEFSVTASKNAKTVKAFLWRSLTEITPIESFATIER